MRNLNGELAATLGGSLFVNDPERRHAAYGAVTFDQGQIGSNDGIRLAQQHANVVTCNLTKQPRQDRTRFSVEVHRISSRPATRQYLPARRPTTLVT